MLELFEGIKTRRAIRKFKDERVPTELVERAVETAKWAPVAPPFRRWEYELVGGETCERLVRLVNANSIHLQHMLNFFSDKDRARIVEYYRSLGNTKCLVFVTMPATIDGWGKKYSLVSVGLELEVFLLALHEVGLGACGLTIPAATESEVLKILDLEGRELIVGFAVGYPDESPEPMPRERAGINLYE